MTGSTKANAAAAMTCEDALTLGQRVLLATRMAVAKHLYDAAAIPAEHHVTRDGVTRRHRRCATIGGAGPGWITDDPVPSTGARAAGRDGL